MLVLPLLNSTFYHAFPKPNWPRIEAGENGDSLIRKPGSRKSRPGVGWLPGRELYRALKKVSDVTAYLELPSEGHGGWSEQTTAKLFAELGRFFNATIYHYDVKVRTPEVVK